MLKPYFILLFLLVITLTAGAQIRKAYITDDGSRTLDSSKAASYILYQKMEGDSAWSTKQYDMNDTIMTIGTFKDEQFTIPYGKFIYYKLLKPKSPIQFKYDYVKHKMDTIMWEPKNFIISKGYFLNGEKTGRWVEYNEFGRILRSSTFEKSKLNGLQQNYNEAGGLMSEGNYVDNKPDGNWYAFGINNDTLKIYNFKDGSFKKRILDKPVEIIDCKPQYDLLQYLNLELADKKFHKLGSFEVLYRLIITKEGKLTKPEVFTASDLEIDSAIINKLLAAPDWDPKYIKKEAVNQIISLNFEVKTSKNKPIQISYPFRNYYKHYGQPN